MEAQSENYLSIMQEVAAKEVKYYGFPGMTVYFDLGSTKVRGVVAAELADPNAELQLTGNEPSRIASMTKTYTGAAILRLVETGQMVLDRGASNYLTEETIALLRSGCYNLDEITVRQLLQHNSGISEHTNDAY